METARTPTQAKVMNVTMSHRHGRSDKPGNIAHAQPKFLPEIEIGALCLLSKQLNPSDVKDPL